MKNFTLKPTIEKALDELHYIPLRPIQSETIPVIWEKKNVFLQATTGSGKTAAYCIPVLNAVDDQSPNSQVLIIAPTRELALQIAKEASSISSYTSIHVVPLIGGLDITKQKNALRHHPHVLVGTCGRLLDLLEQDLLDLSCLKTIIFDEADLLYTSGQLQDAQKLLSLLPDCQKIFVSATGEDFISSLLPEDFEHIKGKEENAVQNYHFFCEDKYSSILELFHYLPITSSILFVSMKSTAQKLTSLLKKEKFLAEDFSSQYSEKQRIQILSRFQSGDTRILVATDAASRGLDILDVSHVIHFDLPTDKETWIHRSGRSGHQGQSGLSLVLLDNTDLQTEDGIFYQENTKPFLLKKEKPNDLSIPLIKERVSQTSSKTFLIRAGRKDKIRPKDIIGAFCTFLDFSDIGKLEIQDTYSLVDIFCPEKISMDSISIKGKQRKVELYKKS